MLILLLFQIIAVCSSSTAIGWDVTFVVDAARLLEEDIDKSSINYYYSLYPNNLLLIFLFNKFINFCGMNSNSYLVLSVINIFCIDLSLYFVYKIMCKLANIKIAIIAFILCIIIYGIFPWIIVPYSDVISMPITTGLLLLYLTFINSTKKIQKALTLFLFSFLLWFGYNIKPTNIIIFISIILVSLFQAFASNRQMMKSVACISIIGLLVLLIGNNIWNNYLYEKQTYLNLDKEKSFPLQHFLMMGLYDGDDLYGTWNGDDFLYSESFSTLNERKAGDIDRFKQKIADNGLINTLKFEYKKSHVDYK